MVICRILGSAEDILFKKRTILGFIGFLGLLNGSLEIKTAFDVALYFGSSDQQNGFRVL